MLFCEKCSLKSRFAFIFLVFPFSATIFFKLSISSINKMRQFSSVIGSMSFAIEEPGLTTSTNCTLADMASDTAMMGSR